MVMTAQAPAGVNVWAHVLGDARDVADPDHAEELDGDRALQEDSTVTRWDPFRDGERPNPDESTPPAEKKRRLHEGFCGVGGI